MEVLRKKLESQFHYGSIKTLSIIPTKQAPQCSLNSTMVRLKPKFAKALKHGYN